ncbi:MAG: DNA starvation/stationary phase protection protein [Candidatus Dependentiae bacterium]|nr:DNA starvation/stationary phase protection protein [Candidatus Dependentiae bacterium]
MCEYDVKVPFDNGVTPEKRQEVIEHLNNILSDGMVLFVKISKYHWNVRSSNFMQLHLFFEKLYEQAFKDADLVAERVRALGGLALGTMKEFLGATRLGEVPERNPSAGEMIGDLLGDYQAVIKHTRSDIERIDVHDPVSANMLMTIVEGQEKTAWMLRAHLEGMKGSK